MHCRAKHLVHYRIGLGTKKVVHVPTIYIQLVIVKIKEFEFLLPKIKKHEQKVKKYILFLISGKIKDVKLQLVE